ncbi:helix-turn-helix transcriptional regulator [Hazenella sp. IB182353]|uniref:helix-turn-helix domain-containing protein n=1 Tax=Polycladospora coralii TaxID=2771432 RepID=UPI00174792FC|nr:helix-turn-helix transcriptional regulator [Polycladospora coralii]MBS7531849.1 helix-turn-helix transcriptional regulator [Polycladospora coralii]
MFDFGKRISELRKSQKSTQEQFAMMLDISRENLSRIENNKITPSMSTLNKICEVTGISIKQFFNPESTSTDNPELIRLIALAESLNPDQLSSLNEFIEKIKE